ncbi:MAG TPA: helix-turn-helix transcriptional regulator [Solirubrobacterales bacterium]|nr:helix-turn-helix transcriptional regulator [Solirubrobacterales bacterium]
MADSVGTKLREARTRRKLSLADVEAATKIRGRYLQAIENDEWGQLPGDTYARAFVRTYGRFLGLDGERLAEEQRQDSGAARPGERLPRVDPRPRPVSRRRPGGGPSVPPKVLAAAVTGLVVVALLVIGLSGGDGSNSGTSGSDEGNAGAKGGQAHGRPGRKPTPPGHSLVLTAKGEVWICLMNGKETPVLDGLILAPGESEGPFRSGSFTIALGNGAVTMTVDGKQQELPEPSSPIGFAVRPDGSVHELPEGERPTCT